MDERNKTVSRWKQRGKDGDEEEKGGEVVGGGRRIREDIILTVT